MPELREIKRVLIATGLTLESVGAVVMGREIAERFGAELHAMHVIEPISQAHEEAIPGLAAAHDAQAQEGLRLFAEAHGLNERVQLHTSRGSAEVEILRAARDLKADLVVVGRYGRGGLKGGRLGSVADRLVRKSPVSVLVAAPEYRGGLQGGNGDGGQGGVAVATGFSEECGPLVQRAVKLANVLGRREVTILHAYSLPVGYHTIMSEEDAIQRLESLAQRRTAKLVETVGDPAGVRLKLLTGRGEARDVVPKLAAEAGVNLLVVGTHGRSLPAMFMLPRVTEAILNNVHCSVWAAKKPEWYQDFARAIEEIVGA